MLRISTLRGPPIVLSTGRYLPSVPGIWRSWFIHVVRPSDRPPSVRRPSAVVFSGEPIQWHQATLRRAPLRSRTGSRPPRSCLAWCPNRNIKISIDKPATLHARAKLTCRSRFFLKLLKQIRKFSIHTPFRSPFGHASPATKYQPRNEISGSSRSACCQSFSSVRCLASQKMLKDENHENHKNIDKN